MQISLPENQNLYIMGFMGCGKTSVARLLAKKLNTQFKDTDQIIEQKYSLSISRIFNEYGESEFRKIEKDVITEVSQLKNHVISLGGGSVLDQDNWNFISSSGFTVTLSLPLEIISSRLKSDFKRPLLQIDKLGKIKKLMEERIPFYKKADLYLHSDSAFASMALVDRIIAHLKSQNWINDL